MMRTLTLVLAALVLAGCGGSVAPSPLASPMTPSPSAVVDLTTPTPAPTPSPTPDPEAIRKTAAAAYLAAAESSNKAFAALDKKYKTFDTLKRARAYYKAAAKIDGDFISKVKAITVPTDTASDLHSLIAKGAAVQALEIEGSGAKSWADVASVQAALTKAYRAETAAANLVRSDLGLPPVHL